MSNFLKDIIEIKKKELKSFRIANTETLKSKFNGNSPMVIIAEIKLSTPTLKGLGSEKDVIAKAKEYQKARADMISVVTEKNFFNGSIGFIKKIKDARITLPILHKDFIIDPYQVYESKFIGADAILLIAKIVDTKTLKELTTLASSLGIEPIVEISDTDDLKKALQTKAIFIAVNARNLNTFKIDIDKACELLRKIPRRYIRLAFSGINSKEEMRRYKNAGAKGVLIGTGLMKTQDVESFLGGLRI